MKLPIFLDNHSTTPMDPRVLEAMLPYFVEKFGNAASRNHAFGWAAEEAVEQARKQIAKLIKADSKEIVFTSGATESDNLALKGTLEMYKEKGTHIITATTEHRAVLDTAKSLEAKGLATVTYLPVDKFGLVNPQDVQNAITDKTILISVMLANNEIGTINPIQEIGKVAKAKGDAVPLRCHPGRRKNTGRCSGHGHRSHVVLGPQTLRTQGSRRALCQKAESPRTDRRPDGRRGS